MLHVQNILSVQHQHKKTRWKFSALRNGSIWKQLLRSGRLLSFTYPHRPSSCLEFWMSNVSRDLLFFFYFYAPTTQGQTSHLEFWRTFGPVTPALIWKNERNRRPILFSYPDLDWPTGSTEVPVCRGHQFIPPLESHLSLLSSLLWYILLLIHLGHTYRQIVDVVISTEIY